MMKTKTIKTPLIMAVAFGPTSCSSGHVPKSELLPSPEAQYGFVPKNSHHGGKNPALRAEKPYLTRLRLSKSITMFTSVMPNGSRLERSSMRSFFSEAVFLPLKMSYVAKQCVVMSWLVRELAHRHKAMTAAQKLGELRHRQRGF
jgi:hypothetical protein